MARWDIGRQPICDVSYPRQLSALIGLRLPGPAAYLPFVKIVGSPWTFESR
jgi:hypothetical protein